eukprot:CAMPEP_0201519648 /NCGR_PEP_ID=MMETSP0161_2-20130828/10151_1 /ASSEMBLY_ACC=CAM_ASM_000251 /TAXON_ID=180227 /ORGANISM="Neoparamoeba aestuarina, Strain SoJaBio B1-5/56/2" /LENGTH=161 /DNA_ID=CAMNT_0047917755 /DNA_START=507 /DNA_END=989 /DNA_ORIENTATION=+
MGNLKIPKMKFKDKDPRKKKLLEKTPHLIHFCVAGGAACMPPLGVLRGDGEGGVEEEMREIVRGALGRMFREEGKIFLPVYLEWHRKDFPKKENDFVDMMVDLSGLKPPHNFHNFDVVFEEENWKLKYFLQHFQKKIKITEAILNYPEGEEEEKEEEKEEE